MVAMVTRCRVVCPDSGVGQTVQVRDGLPNVWMCESCPSEGESGKGEENVCDWRTGERKEGVARRLAFAPLSANEGLSGPTRHGRHIMSDTEDIISVFVSKVSL